MNTFNASTTQLNAIDKIAVKNKGVDLEGYVIIVVQTKDNKVKLYGSPSGGNLDNLELADEIMDVNETKLEDMSRAEVIGHIHECISSCVIKLRVKRRSEMKLLSDIGHNIVQDAFLIAVEEQARQRLQRLSALKRITPVDMTKLSLEIHKKKLTQPENRQELNGYIANSTVYVTSINENGSIETKPTISSPKAQPKAFQATPAPVIANGIQEKPKEDIPELLEKDQVDKLSLKVSVDVPEVKCEVKSDVISDKSDAYSVAREHLNNGRSEKLIGEQPEHRIRATAVVENNRLGPGEKGPRRRSGCSIVVVGAEEEKLPPPPDEGGDVITMLALSDNGPHREMAVDVPDSFIARNKTPPRYPPPRPPQVRREDEALLLSSGSSFNSKHSIIQSPDASSSDTGSFKIDCFSELVSGASIGSKNSSDTAKCGDIAEYDTNKIKLLISSGENSILDGVSYSVKSESVLIREALYASYKLPPGFDSTPVLLGREVAVDVPDSFVHIVKTTPKYPGTVDRKMAFQVNGTAKSQAPAVPPREISRDAPPRPPTLDNGNEADSIKKYQVQLRQRKEAEERIAAQNEFLRTSLRGSHKLHALESTPHIAGAAFINDAYDHDEEDVSQLYAPIDYQEVTAAFGRLQKALQTSGDAGLGARVAQARSAACSAQLQVAIATRAVVLLARRPYLPRPADTRAVDALTQSLEVLSSQPPSGVSPPVAELVSLLAGAHFEALLQAHDQVIRALPEDAFSHKTGNHINHKSDTDRSQANSPEDSSERIKIIKIDKTNEPLGATVRNEGESVIIGRIVRGGAAEKSGLLHEGDELLEVNGVPMRGKSVHEVCQLLGALSGTLSMVLATRSSDQPSLTRNSGNLRVLHVRAHFDYDPEDDVYIPCKELGISFQKGDVLHVISRADPNWWQAFREGEEEHSLAGLIPSQAFQHQRESMKQTLAGEVAAREKPNRKGGTLLCGKKGTRRKKGKKASSEAGYPLYSTSTTDADAECDTILTYEEVALYYPRVGCRRPVVLVGPADIGRHELRQRLMRDSERFAAAVPHTSRPRKDHEIPGQDYHFISRAQFEADILNRKFVEHGEYEKAYYGTSLEAIRAVVTAGKICVLNLHPASLSALRRSDLKPYTVFVAPPSLDKLRQNKLQRQEPFKEEDLKEIIATAREMELKWGHLFDMIIINNDTQRAYQQLLHEINSLEREPQWVPAVWLKQT